MNTPRWMVMIVLALALAILVMPVSAAPSASITITPPLPNPVPIGSEVSLALVITVTEITPGVSGADIYLGYDDKFVAPPTSPNSVVEALPDFFGVSDIGIKEILPAAQCPGGTSPCVHLVAAGPAQVTHSGAVARFHFQIIKEGEACFKLLASTLANKDGFPVSHTSPDPKCINSGFDVSGTVLRQGTPANPNPGGGTLACSEVKLLSGSMTVGPVSTYFPPESGTFTFKNVPGGTYKVHAEYPGYLASETRTLITIPPSQEVGTTELCGGDVNFDYKINILDIGTIIGKFGKTGVEVRSDAPDCTDPDEPVDINDDGNVNIGDVAIAAGNWGRTGSTPWQPTGICDP